MFTPLEVTGQLQCQVSILKGREKGIEIGTGTEGSGRGQGSWDRAFPREELGTV